MFARRNSPEGGFTLLETLVVMVISVALVAMMTGLFRVVGSAFIALGGDEEEWRLQNLLRDQLRNGHVTQERPQFLAGDRDEITLVTWKGRRFGFDGHPVVARYRFNAQNRSIDYQEVPLPDWWSPQTRSQELRDLTYLLDQEPTATRLVRGVENGEFAYYPQRPENHGVASVANHWLGPAAPAAVVIHFSRAQQDNEYWLEPRAIRGG
jgi:Tfp pilus assembly protein PilV